MENILYTKQEVIIIPQEVILAERGMISDIFDNGSFKIKLNTRKEYNKGDSADLFSVAGSGVIYINSEIENVEENYITIKKPKITKTIQRREYTRIELHKNILIEHNSKKIRAEIVDISAGGMRLLTETEMFKNTNYHTDINLNENIYISCTFKPVRISFNKETSLYNVSGKFSLIKNIDRVTLVQYCMKKQSETQNK